MWTKQAVFFKALPERSLAEKKSQARGGKKSKTRLTISFFVNAAGKKAIEPLVVWRSKKPCCFKYIKSLSRPHGIYYYSNPKAWMTTEIMTSDLGKINRQMEVAKRKIMLFMDNAPCHPESLRKRYSNIKVVLLPKNTTSRLQPLDAGIIRNFKLKYCKKLLKFVILRINNNVKATDIIQEAEVLKAISWIKSAWGEVSEKTIVNCFKKCGFRKSQPDVQFTDFVEEEEFESLVKELSTDVSAAEYIDFDREVVTSQPSIDVKNIAWRQESGQNAIDTVMGCHNDQEHLKDIESDNEEVTIDDSLAIKSISEALQLVDQITCFTRQYEDSEINESLEVVTEKLQDMIRNSKRK